ncbi:hypothetical protein ABG067_005128 [Albugo candida]
MLQQRYEIHHTIGEALYGQVWFCLDQSFHNRPVAIKQIDLAQVHQVLLGNKQMDNPFNEGLTIHKLMSGGKPHNHILQFYDAFIVDQSYYVVMEYCEGGDLLDLLQSMPQHRFPEPIAMRYFRQIVHGLRHLHTQNIAHRDISLENILMKRNQCKICDFGLSTPAHRMCSETVGKAYYMAPEVVLGEQYDPAAADVWSLGILLFIMLTGSPLTPSASEEEKAFMAFKKYGVAGIIFSWEMHLLLSDEVVDLLSGLLQLSPLKRLTIEEIILHSAFATNVW